MNQTLHHLSLDFVEWIAIRPRSYQEAMDAWRTSCPRLAVWEEAVDRNFVVRLYESGAGATIWVTDSGLDFLKEAGRLTHQAEEKI